MVQHDTQQNKPPTARWLFPFTIALAIGGGTVYLYNLLQARSTSQTLPPSPAQSTTPELTAVSALGRLEPRGEITRISAPASSEGTRIDRLLIQEGDRVSKDQVLAILDGNGRRQASLQSALAEVEVAQANLDIVKAGAKRGDLNAQQELIYRLSAELNGQIASQQATISNLESQLQGERNAQEATIERIRAELANAQTDCNRYQTLQSDGAVSEQERDRICLQQTTNEKQLKEAQANLQRIVETYQDRISEARANLNRTVQTLQIQQNEARSSLDSLAEVRPVDVQLAEAELIKAKTAVLQAQQDLALTYIRSPLEGQVIKVHSRAGEVIGSEGIAEIGRTDQMYVVAEVYETDIAKIRPGQKAIVTSAAVQGQLQGQVAQIGLQVKPQKVFENNPLVKTDNKVIDVKIRLDPQSSQRVARFSNLQSQVVIYP
jgi:HlyD family secretion protein